VAELSSSALGDWPPSRRSGALARHEGGRVAQSRHAGLESLRYAMGRERTSLFKFCHAIIPERVFKIRSVAVPGHSHIRQLQALRISMAPGQRQLLRPRTGAIRLQALVDFENML